MKRQSKRISNNNSVLTDIASRELSVVDSYIETQEKLNAKILSFLQTLTNTVTSNSSYASQNSLELSNVLHELSKILVKSDTCLSTLQKIKQNLSDAASKLSESDEESIKLVQNFYELYALNFDEILAAATESEAYLNNTSVQELYNHVELSGASSDESFDTVKTSKIISGTTDECENVLLITDTKIVLPYKISELVRLVNDKSNQFSSTQEVIDALYTKSVKYYKNASIARFREAYKLSKKENPSFKAALDLALEMFFNYNVHPAIISACRTLNELDIYLSCLEYNELEDFKCFKIVFLLSPSKPFHLFKKLKNTNSSIQSNNLI